MEDENITQAIEPTPINTPISQLHYDMNEQNPKTSRMRRMLGLLLSLALLCIGLAVLISSISSLFARTNTWAGLSLMFIAPGIVALFAAAYYTRNYSLGYISGKRLLNIIGISIAVSVTPLLFLVYATKSPMITAHNSLNAMAAQVKYEIYQPDPTYYKSMTNVRFLMDDGPINKPNFKNPETNTSNLGVYYEGEGLVIYDKNLIPDEFEHCAPDDVRNSYDQELTMLKTRGCQKSFTSPMGRDVYTMCGSGDMPVCISAMDIGNSRIVLKHDQSPTYITLRDTKGKITSQKFSTYADYGANIDSFHAVDLYSLEFNTGNEQVKPRK
jgi:hypothetical protein